MRYTLTVAASLCACLCLGSTLFAQNRAADKGADGWAYRAPARPPVPQVKHAVWVRNPIDAFIAARLERAGLAPAPELDRARLLRRVSFDLVGLPPTPQELADFLADPAPDAYEKAVERLLTSPRHGERWATYWLDLVRFAESDGFRADSPRPTAWRYRDYVVKSFNQDKPYDRFLKEQLAGDELYPGDPDALVATAFNRHFPDEFNARNLDQRRQEILNDVTDTTGQVFLGLTLGCARCHDHKYDPISQKDYFRIQAFFAALSPRDELVLAGPEEVAEHERRMQVWREQTATLRKKMEELEAPYEAKLHQRDKSKFAKELQAAYDTPPEKRTPFQQQIAELLAKQVTVPRADMVKAMKPEVKKEWQALDKQLAGFDHLKPPPLSVSLGATDVGPVAPPTHLLKRGNHRTPGEEVEPGFLSALGATAATIPAPSPGATTTGRRAVLAQWLTRPDHPLTARVMINRLWQHHFGRGIVGTPSDFGSQGEQATHPELLDWLAREFVESGWSLRHVHRLIVTSAAYRQSSAHNQAAAKIDPDNRLLWRVDRRRLEGEALRDAMLAVSGRLNVKMGGPSVFPELPAEMNVPKGRWPVTADAAERDRRSVYVFAKRNLRYPLFSAFDAPDGNEPCARRHVSTNAPQALMLLNGQLTLELARAFAGRVLREAPGTSEQVGRAYLLALGRGPDARESELAAAFLARQTPLLRTRIHNGAPVATPTGAPAGTDPAQGAALVDLCQVLLNLNEFAYVD